MELYAYVDRYGHVRVNTNRLGGETADSEGYSTPTPHFADMIRCSLVLLFQTNESGENPYKIFFAKNSHGILSKTLYKSMTYSSRGEVVKNSAKIPRHQIRHTMSNKLHTAS